MKTLALLSLSLVLSAPVLAQMRCATDMSPEQRQADQKNYLLSRELSTAAPVFKTTAVSLPVVFHVLYHDASQNIPDSSLLANLKVLNRAFAKHNPDTAQIPAVFRSHSASLDWHFCLALVDPQGNPTTGIVRKYTDSLGFSDPYTPYDPATGGADLWPSGQYVNIIITNITGGAFYAFATYPINPTYQGITVDYEYTGEFVDGGGVLLTHEMGHYFYLYHIFGTSPCGDDLVGDTPPQQGPSLILPNDSCPVFPHVTCSNGPDGDNFYDYMDYSRCASMFTAGQVARMQNTLTTMRSSLLSSPAGCHFTTSIKDLSNAASVYPNPSSGSFTVIDDANKYDLLQVFDVAGRMIKAVSIKQRQQVVLQQTGIYIYRLSGRHGTATGKLVVQ
jgi:hypothetical protein